MSKKVAVLLCGSGFLDGSEIRESVGVLWSLSREGIQSDCFAPDRNQHHVMDTLKQKESSEERNMLVESARIARSHIRPLRELNAQDYEGLAIPGGYGVAKNLCTFAFKAFQGSVSEDVSGVLQEFHQNKKPILAVCIAPVLLGLALRPNKLELTLGASSEISSELEKLGHIHKECGPNEYHRDREHNIFSTPAYMYDNASLNDIFNGIGKAAKEFCQNL